MYVCDTNMLKIHKAIKCAFSGKKTQRMEKKCREKKKKSHNDDINDIQKGKYTRNDRNFFLYLRHKNSNQNSLYRAHFFFMVFWRCYWKIKVHLHNVYLFAKKTRFFEWLTKTKTFTYLSFYFSDTEEYMCMMKVYRIYRSNILQTVILKLESSFH